MAGSVIVFGFPIENEGEEYHWCEGCSEYTPMDFMEEGNLIIVNESEITIEAGALRKIYVTSLDIKPKWRSQLLAFCKKNNLEFKEPGWYLTSYE